MSLESEIKEIIAFLTRDEFVMGPIAGYCGEETEKWKKFLQLKSLATVDELESLVDHKSPVIQCYAFMALADRDDYDIFPLLVENLDRYDIVTTIDYDLVTKEKVSNFFIEYAEKSLTPEQFDELDEIIIENDYKVYRRFLIMSNEDCI